MRVISIIMGFFLVFGGFSMMMNPGMAFLSVGWILGFVFIVSGINQVVDYIAHKKNGDISKWDLVNGILGLIFGTLILLSPYVMIIAKIMTVYVFNFWLIISGILRIAAAFEIKKAGGKGWIWVALLAVLTVAVGFYALFNILVSAVAMGWMLGFFVLMSGINYISAGFTLKEKEAK